MAEQALQRQGRLRRATVSPIGHTSVV